MELLEKKQAMKELLKERRNTKVEEWRDTVDVGGEVAQMAAARSRSSEAEGGLLLFELGVLQKRFGGRPENFRPSQGAAAEKEEQ